MFHQAIIVTAPVIPLCQGCHQGRGAKAVDGTLIKIDGSKAGCDFTKIGSDAVALIAQNEA